MEDRFNTPHTAAVEVDVLGHSLHIVQDPNSKHLGTTVWDSSVVFVKFLEKNSRKGEFSRANMAGKRAIELGAGCGLAGLGMALLGCDVVVTDQVDVLPLLLRNSERNLARAKYTASENSFAGPVGSVEVAELDWGNELQIAAVGPPFDFIVGTDVVYKEHLLEPLFKTINLLSGPKTKVILAYEFRASDVKEKLDRLLKDRFSVKKVQRSKMDSKYQHANIELYILAPLPEQEGVSGRSESASLQADSCSPIRSDSDNSSTERGIGSQWESRRMGASAARLLASIEVPAMDTALD